MQRGTVVLVRFPFSDLSAAKLRPALVLADAGRGDFVLAQITSRPYADPLAVPLAGEDFAQGSLERTSYVRPGKLFTANEALLVRPAGVLRRTAHARVVESVIALLRHEG